MILYLKKGTIVLSFKCLKISFLVIIRVNCHILHNIIIIISEAYMSL
jgi:hypothetical protein